MKTLTLPPSLIDQAILNDPHLLSPHSKRQYSANLRKFEAWRGVRLTTKLLVETYIAELQAKDLAPDTINQKLASIRWWARKIIDIAHETLPGDEADIIAKQAARVLTIKNVTGSRPQRGRHLKSSELVALLTACHADHSPSGKRDAALFICAWTTGLRRAELGSIRLQDIDHQEETDQETGKITHFAEIKIIGKGDKARSAYIIEEAYAALNDWLLVREDVPGFVFCPVHKSGEPRHESGLSGEALRKIALKRSKEARLKKHLTWHDFRRTFAGNLLDENDLATVQALLGHASPTTTSTYDRRPEARRLEAVRSLKMPKIGEK